MSFYQEACFDPTYNLGDVEELGGVNVYLSVGNKAYYAPDQLVYNAISSYPLYPGVQDSIYCGISDKYETYIYLTADPLINYDINKDSKTNAADIVAMYNYILTGSDNISRGYVDINKDGDVNSADIVAIYNHIINGEEPPQSPPTD